MVSPRKAANPDNARAPALDLAVADGLLRRLADENRTTFLEPWRGMLAASPELQRDVDRTVGALQVFFSKWVVEIVIVLGQGGRLRFNVLKNSLSGISSRTLAQRLRELEARGLVEREMFDEMPVRVEYSLTKKGTDVAALALPLVLYLLRDGVDE